VDHPRYRVYLDLHHRHLIAFRSSYLDNFGDEIIEGSRIAGHYIKSSRFWTDVLSLVSNPVVA